MNDDEKMRRAHEKYVKGLKSGSMRDSALNSRFEFGSTMGADLATPIVSAQDGPRMTGVSNFGGKKAAPFVKGGKRRKAVLAKAAVKGAKWSKSKDTAYDKAHGIKEGSAKDKALDKKHGVKDMSNVDLSTLTSAERKALPPSAFVFPGKRAYPIHDLAHAKDALARSSGKPEAAAVRAAVLRRYPQLRKG